MSTLPKTVPDCECAGFGWHIGERDHVKVIKACKTCRRFVSDSDATLHIARLAAIHDAVWTLNNGEIAVLGAIAHGLEDAKHSQAEKGGGA